MDTARRNANLMLLTAAAIWGFAFVAQRLGLDHVGPLTFNGVRFALGAGVLAPLVIARRRRGVVFARGLKRAGIIGGVLIFGGATLQQWGLTWTTAGKAGFITSLYVVLTPLLGMVLGQRTGKAAWTGALLAALGLYLLSAQGLTGLAPGDGLVLIGAFFWGAHVVWIGYAAPRTDGLQLAMVQFITCAVLSLAGAFVLEAPAPGPILAAGIPILYAGVLSVGGAYTLQVLGQRHARPAPAAVILSLESVFAALGGWAMLGEEMSLRGAAGCVLMMGGVLVSQLGTPQADPAPSGS